MAISAGAQPIAKVTGTRATPAPKYFVGSGKAEEIRQWVESTHAQLILFNHELSPSQERNLEKLCKCRVLDRTGLILDIFAKRARTFEGKLQVELAQLQHLSTRLVRGWTHLERQRGGIGLRGPGETQLEVDRRLIDSRIRTIKRRLIKVRAQRAQGRKSRIKAGIPTVSIVGYTNAGKSTLFNRLTKSEVYTAHQLFATLDPTLRRLKLPTIGYVILADTVGFIRHLPHNLVEAFRATLEETQQADLLLHVVDAADPRRHELITSVNEVLKQIDADDIPQLQIYNKLDLLPEQKPHIDADSDGNPIRVWLSAVKEQGLDLLEKALIAVLSPQMITTEINLSAEEGKLRAYLYELDAVIVEQKSEEGGWSMRVKMPKITFDHMMQQRGKK